MTFENYFTAYQQMADWCLDEAVETQDPAERALWLDAAEFWRERAVRAALAQRAVDRGPDASDPPPDAD
jgi:hypothetical protein